MGQQQRAPRRRVLGPRSLVCARAPHGSRTQGLHRGGGAPRRCQRDRGHLQDQGRARAPEGHQGHGGCGQCQGLSQDPPRHRQDEEPALRRAQGPAPRLREQQWHRSGQGAFGNQCRGGRMFNPTKQWRKWTAKTNNNERRVAVCSALAASSVPALLMARGHKVSTVAEVPLVVANEIEATSKTKDALALLKVIKAMEDVDNVKDSRKIRRGTGKMRNRRYVERKGPLLVYANNNGI